jgi:hypothetical protein
MSPRKSATQRLAGQLVSEISAYLDGERSGRDVSAWAAHALDEYRFDSSELLLDETLSALVVSARTIQVSIRRTTSSLCFVRLSLLMWITRCACAGFRLGAEPYQVDKVRERKAEREP